MHFFFKHSLLTSAALATASLSAQAAIGANPPLSEPEELPSITVHGTPALLPFDTVEQAESTVAGVAGGASLLNLETDYIGRVNTTADIFKFDPGVYAQAGSVVQDSRLSVRGSGATRRYGNRGLSLLIDGIPANSIDGSFYTRAYNPLNTKYVQVFRGGNGLAHGGAQIGGVINFVQKTGLSNPDGEAQFEYGSFETSRNFVGYGLQNGASDAYVSASWNQSDGYRSHQSSREFNTTANYGYRWSESAYTRAYLLYSDSDADLASGLSLYDATHNPKDSHSDGAEDRDLSTFRVAQKTAIELDQTQVEWFTYYQILDLDHLTRSQRPANLIDYDTAEYGIGARTTSDFQVGMFEQQIRTSLLYNWGDNDIGGYRSVYGFGRPRSLKNDYTDSANTFQVYLENESYLTESLSLIYGIGWQHAERERHIHGGQQNDRGSTISNYDQSYDGYTPRMAVLYALPNGWTLFANYDQSFEPPSFGESSGDLDAQIARTYEIGTRVVQPRFSGELSYYHSKIKDDFIDADTTGNGSFNAENYDTERQGVETAWTLILWPATSERSRFEAYIDVSYQYSHFTFDGGEYDNNQLPGIGEHLYSTRLRIEAPDQRWRTSISLERMASGLEVNNANTLQSTSPFTLINIAGDYKITPKLTLYGGVDNLFDERYVNTVTINPFNNNTSKAYSPGNGISAYIGMRMQF